MLAADAAVSKCEFGLLMLLLATDLTGDFVVIPQSWNVLLDTETEVLSFVSCVGRIKFADPVQLGGQPDPEFQVTVNDPTTISLRAVNVVVRPQG